MHYHTSYGPSRPGYGQYPGQGSYQNFGPPDAASVLAGGPVPYDNREVTEHFGYEPCLGGCWSAPSTASRFNPVAGYAHGFDYSGYTRGQNISAPPTPRKEIEVPDCTGGQQGAPGCFGPEGGCTGESALNSVEFVGSGEGQYVKETIYKYVGNGGDFDLVEQRNCRLMFSTCCCGLVLLIVGILFFWPFPEQGATSLLFDCDADYLQWRYKWTDVKKAYCCDFADKGCSNSDGNWDVSTPTPEVAPASQHQSAQATRPRPRVVTATAPPIPQSRPQAGQRFDCTKQFASWTTSWSFDQKAYCCKTTGKGCPQAGKGGCAAKPAKTATPCPDALV